MKYQIKTDKYIQIFGKDDFLPADILECGQIFSYKKNEDTWEVFSKDKFAKIEENENGFLILTNDTTYFEIFFDLKTDYGKIKQKLSEFEILKKPILFGHGIRILKQDLFETLISFIVSANNNIKRIQLILGRIREKYGTKIGNFYAFPTREQLLGASAEDFAQLGAGYRAPYLWKVLRQIDEKTLHDWSDLPTAELRKNLIALAGIGPKVADCVLLFGFGRKDVFPVDTWIEKMFFKYYGKQFENRPLNREKIRHILTGEFGFLSGYAQQYLFYFMRSGVE